MRRQSHQSGKGGRSPRLFTASELHMKLFPMPFRHLFLAVYNPSDLFSMISLQLWFGNLCSISKEVKSREPNVSESERSAGEISLPGVL